MGDHRISIDIELMGMGGKVAKIEWWINWSDDVPVRLAKALSNEAERVGLRADIDQILERE